MTLESAILDRTVCLELKKCGHDNVTSYFATQLQSNAAQYFPLLFSIMLGKSLVTIFPSIAKRNAIILL